MKSYQSRPQLQEAFCSLQKDGGYYNQAHNAWYIGSYNNKSSTPSSPSQLKKNSELLELCYRNVSYPRETCYIMPKEGNYGRFPSPLALPKVVRFPTNITRITEPTLNNSNLQPPISPYHVRQNLSTNLPSKASPVHSSSINIDLVSHESNTWDFHETYGDKLKQEIKKYQLWNRNSRQKIPLDLNAAYLKLSPLIQRTTPNNINELFVATLLECLHHMPLDDLFILLFNDVTPEQVSPIPIGGTKVDKSPYTCFKNEALNLCYYILETFKTRKYNSPNYPIKLVHNPILFRMNLFEVRRTFLAIKILFDSFIEVQGPLGNMCTISRPSIQNAYHLICKSLLEKYPTSSKLLPSMERVEVCLSRLGRMTKLVYSRISLRRLGKRGGSVYHYVGLTWNKNIVDDEIVRAIKDATCAPKEFSKIK